MGLKKSTESVVKTRRVWLKQAIEARNSVDEFPKELQELEGEVDSIDEETLKVTFSKWNNKEKDLLRICKTAGVQELNPKMGSNKHWYAQGVSILPSGRKLTVYLSGLEQPPTCVVEEYTELVTRYKAICTQTGVEF